MVSVMDTFPDSSRQYLLPGGTLIIPSQIFSRLCAVIFTWNDFAIFPLSLLPEGLPSLLLKHTQTHTFFHVFPKWVCIHLLLPLPSHHSRYPDPLFTLFFPAQWPGAWLQVLSHFHHYYLWAPLWAKSMGRTQRKSCKMGEQRSQWEKGTFFLISTCFKLCSLNIGVSNHDTFPLSVFPPWL